jgi:flagellar biosynthetic protein FliQ
MLRADFFAVLRSHMNQDAVLHLLAQTLLTAAKIGAPVLLAILIVGLLVSILQVATQIQEMTLTFIPKLAVTVLVLLVCGGWMLSTLREFAVEVILQAATR